MIKVLLSETLEGNTITHATVYSSKKLSEPKAIQAAKTHLRAQGFTVTDMTVDAISNRSAMVSAFIR
jgi:hypothetical protein